MFGVMKKVHMKKEYKYTVYFDNYSISSDDIDDFLFWAVGSECGFDVASRICRIAKKLCSGDIIQNDNVTVERR